VEDYSQIYTFEVEEVLKTLSSNADDGLSSEEVNTRLQKYGQNRLVAKKQVSKIEILVRQIKSIIVVLLLVAGLVSFTFGHFVEGIAVFAVLVFNTTIGFFTELKAVRSMEALKNMGTTKTRLIREGEAVLVEATELVPGDIVLVEAGDIVTADLRLLESSKIAVDESILTGESLPVEKSTKALEGEAVLAERYNLLFKGTSLTRGSGKAIVFATGMQTEVGKVVKATQEASDELTPLEKRLDELGKQLIWVSLVIGLIIAAAGVYSGKAFTLMLETAIALAIATIPEGLPIVATLALGKGMWRMAKSNALINKLAAVETLGATSIIFSDKTGTLTENKMSVRSYQTANHYFDLNNSVEQDSDRSLQRCLEIGVLCNNSSEGGENSSTFLGDPMEIALIAIASKLGVDYKNVQANNPELKEVAFDSETLMMATYHKSDATFWVAVKGAPEVVLGKCTYQLKNGEKIPLSDEERKLWFDHNKRMANDGLRVLGLAFKDIESEEERPYSELILCGLVGLLDPARSDIKKSLDQCRSAGIETFMITGDQEGTAIKIAKDTGLVEDSNVNVIHGKNLPERELWDERLEKKILETRVFCRVSPEQKYDLIGLLQSRNHVVAMTGDGVNDAPALRRADIGIAMGLRGTQVAKEAADMVLQDDLFSTIVSAIKQGRIIYSNIQRFVLYLLSCNISEILIISLASAANSPLPLLPLHILFLNLVTDVFPALALGMGEGDESYLKLKPRSRESDIITKRSWFLIVFYGGIITASVLGAFYYAFMTTQNENIALTVSFLSLGLVQVFHVFNMRLEGSSFINNDVTRNIHVWGAVLLCISLLVMSVKIPWMRTLLKLVEINNQEWSIVLIASLAPLVLISLLSRFKLGIRS
jgi:Ca2+-transporting ATPase